ncbi:fungal-specific transcription factor domain-containing protein, partial [Geopyxis carbonaria]
MAHRPAKTQTFPRPIRFVSNDGFPHAKRRRISAACLTCRKRKTRCSGEKPACDTCKQNGHECKGYREAPPRNVSTGTVTPGAGTSGYQSTATTPVTEHPHSHMFASPSGSHSGHDSQRHASMSSQSGTPGPPPMGNLLGLQSPGFPSNEGPKRKHDDEQLFAGSRRVSMADDGSPILQYQSPPNTQRLANRMPYFRYFGPTAIVPGYKQMVVEVRNPKPPGPASRSASSASSVTSPVSPYASLNSAVLKQPEASPAMTDEDLPLYDQNDPAPSHRLIGHLVETFFTHVGCNFPFLRRAAFMRDVEAKQVDAILVDAVCAVSARFSSDAMLVAKGGLRSAAGTQYANRAKSAMVETFACPNLAAVQACLLLAYAEFGGNRDSGLWMFLGCAIRMAQDLGLHKFMGDATAEHSEHPDSSPSHDAEELDTEERSNTFWAVYLLDRVISSGTGRPVALKDREIEIRMPAIDDAPFPALIRIIHLYGRVTDILNTSTSATSGDTMRRLGGMEADLTSLYSKLSPALHFNVANFQHFISTNQSSVFLLLHFWFHALIALLHRPTLFIGFEGRLRQLFPNSHELSMSSAKTIADIVAFAELLDLKALIGTPFNSQPIYIAACAFLQESAALSASSPSSSSTSHATSSSTTPSSSRPPTPTAMANHTLLAQAAQQNYQNCHKTLQAIEPYWAGVKYILTVMDQKAKGIVDPLLYTTEEMEAVEVHRWGPRVWSSWR